MFQPNIHTTGAQCLGHRLEAGEAGLAIVGVLHGSTWAHTKNQVKYGLGYSDIVTL